MPRELLVSVSVATPVNSPPDIEKVLPDLLDIVAKIPGARVSISVQDLDEGEEAAT